MKQEIQLSDERGNAGCHETREQCAERDHNKAAPDASPRKGDGVIKTLPRLVAAANEARGALAQAESNLRSTRDATVPEAMVKAQTDVEAARQATDAATAAQAQRPRSPNWKPRLGVFAVYSEANLDFLKAEGFTSVQLRLDPDNVFRDNFNIVREQALTG